MKFKILKNIVHEGVLHLAGTVAELTGPFDEERLIKGGHIAPHTEEETQQQVAEPTTPEAPAKPADETADKEGEVDTLPEDVNEETDPTKF